MPSNTKEYTREYRATHPERYEKDKIENNERYLKKYHNDPEFREKRNKYFRERYALLKQLKANNLIVSN
jgi:hypothetical protein